jgi:hypothetical protein
MNEESMQTIDKLEKRLTDQQTFNSNIMVKYYKYTTCNMYFLLYIVVLYYYNMYIMQLTHTPVMLSLSASFTKKILEEKGISKKPKSFNDSDTRLEHHDSNIENNNSPKTSSFTQTNLAIDPETSIKLSFISAGISSYGSSIEYSNGKSTITSTPASSKHYISASYGSTESHGHGQTHQFQRNADRVSPTALSKDFVDHDQNEVMCEPTPIPIYLILKLSFFVRLCNCVRYQQQPKEQEDAMKSPRTADKQTGRPPTFPSASTPSKQTAPLKSILRTPTHEKSSGPLSSFSPSLSPIQSCNMEGLRAAEVSAEKHKSSESVFDNSRAEEDEEGGGKAVNLSASLFMSPLHYDSSDASLQSLSLLNVTTNTTLASGVSLGAQKNDEGHYSNNTYRQRHSYSAREATRKKTSPARTRR